MTKETKPTKEPTKENYYSALYVTRVPVRRVGKHSAPDSRKETKTMETLTTVQTRPPETSMFVSAVALGTERRSVSRARHHTTAVLGAWEMQGLSHSAELVVSELVTNALQAVWTASLVLPVLMLIRSDGERLIIEVWDAAPAAPELRQHAADAIGGRGLEIVSLISDSWGYCPEHGGKVVWAALRAR